jgi:hypothetical protein
MSSHHIVEQNYNINIDYKSFENLARFKCLGKTVRNQNCIIGKIKSILNSGNAWYHAFQDLLSSRLISKNVKIEIYKTIILPRSVRVTNLVCNTKKRMRIKGV